MNPFYYCTRHRLQECFITIRHFCTHIYSAASINEFLSFRRYDILPDKGKISARQAKEKAEAEYDLFNPTQKIVSDFDKVLKQLAP